MNGREFIRKARRYARAHGVSFFYDPSEGKRSHGRVYIGDKATTVKYGEISRHLLADMLKQLDINSREF